MREVINNTYSELVHNIESYFSQSTEIMHKARNEIKIVEYQGQKLVIKSFKRPNFINRIAYALGKDSKAKKSYTYALQLDDCTPKPIAYIEFFKGSFVKQSYFIAEHFDYDFTIREVLLDPDFENREPIFQAFATFTKVLHDKGILHHDYSPGNILIQQQNNTYTFKIVDINRMQFKILSRQERVANFAKLWANEHDLEIIMRYYSEDSEDLKKAIAYSSAHKNKKKIKKKIKKLKEIFKK